MATAIRHEYEATANPMDVSRAELYRDDVWQVPFAKLRAEAPVH